MAIFDSEFVRQSINAKIIGQIKKDFEGVGTDTRAPLKDQLFFALKGDAFDAHKFLTQAIGQGATGLVVHDETILTDELKAKATIFLVPDTLVALQKLAHHHRLRFTIPIIGITGSNGKTTTKEFTAQILGQYRKVHYNHGSFNNHWGVPLTLLDLRAHHEVMICEMGMNHPGEIKLLVEIAVPTHVVVTTVGRAHLEGLGSIEATAKAKNEIYEYSDQDCISIFNLDNPWTKRMYLDIRKKNKPSLRFCSDSDNESCEVSLACASMSATHLRIRGRIDHVQGEVLLDKVFGKQNLTNLMAAASIALSVGLKPEEIWKALPHCQSTWGRNQFLRIHDKASILFDAYNANPDSMEALLDNLEALGSSNRLIGVLGDMRELGDHSEALHQDLGRQAGKVPFGKIYYVGAFAKAFEQGLKGRCPLETYPNPQEQIAKNLLRDLEDAKTGKLPLLIAFKASRGVELEKIVQSIDPKLLGKN